MIVSAVSSNFVQMYNNAMQYTSNKPGETNSDTSFNSLTPYCSRKNSQQDKLPQIFDNINEWQNYCHKRILGEKLNIIA